MQKKYIFGRNLKSVLSKNLGAPSFAKHISQIKVGFSDIRLVFRSNIIICIRKGIPNVKSVLLSSALLFLRHKRTLTIRNLF